ncbi:MAG: hypothetical protein KF799_02635 [Bdellovibrionales bacterium]|nr:hypothetical protein [Bdellovibrionales bacterium]
MTHVIQLFLYSALLIPALAFAQDMSFLGGAVSSGLSLATEHQSFSAPEASPGLTTEEQRMSLNGALFSNSDSSFSLIARGDKLRLGKPIVFQDRALTIPQEFGSAEVGFSWNQRDWMENKFALSATYGAAGTQLLDNGKRAIVSANLSWERASYSTHSWIYFVSYSNNRPTLNNIPIPGIAYSEKGKTYHLLLGVPFAFVNWRPDPLSVSLMLSPFAASSDIGLRILGPIQLFGSIAWAPKSYQNLIDKEDEALIYDKKELAGGLRLFLGPRFGFTASYTHAFDRRFLIGKSVLDSTSDKVAIDDSDGFSIKLRFSL